MAFKCLECGHIFEKGEQAEWEEKHGLETPPYERFGGCPLCKGAYEETERCFVCEAEFLQGELINGVCECCVEKLKDEYRYSPEKCYELSKDEMEKVDINYFLSCMFTKSEIEDILFQNIQRASSLVLIDCSPFIEADKSWFEERIVEEVKK